MNGQQIIEALKRKGITITMLSVESGWRERIVNHVIVNRPSLNARGAIALRVLISRKLGIDLDALWDSPIITSKQKICRPRKLSSWAIKNRSRNQLKTQLLKSYGIDNIPHSFHGTTVTNEQIMQLMAGKQDKPQPMVQVGESLIKHLVGRLYRAL